LAHRQRREDLVHQMCGHLGHVSGVARRAHRAAFAGKCNQEIVSAVCAPGTGEAVGQDAALQIAAELRLHVLRHALAIGVPLAGERQIGFQMALNGAVQRSVFGVAPAIDRARACALHAGLHLAGPSGSKEQNGRLYA
jgi:hypothetical protein